MFRYDSGEGIYYYLFVSRHEVHSTNTHSAQFGPIKTDKTERCTTALEPADLQGYRHFLS